MPAIKPPVAVKAVAPIVGVPKVAPAKSIYSKPRPVAKRDWELPQKPSQSLEALFSKPKSTISPSTGFFRKPASTSVRETKVVFPSAKLAKEKARKHWGGARILKFIGLIVLLLIVLLAFDIFGLYQLGFRDTVSYQVSQNLQLPAGSVNGSYIPLANYLSDVQLLNLPMSQKREGMFDYTDQTDIKAKIFYRLAALDIMTQKLTGYGKSVTMADMDNQVNLLLQQTGGKDQAEKIVGNLYGLNLAQFREKILGPMLLREGLQQAIINDETVAINKAAKDRADEVLKLAQVSSTDFAALAHQYSDDEASINTGGDLGWVIKGQLDQQWENLIFLNQM